jgi:hypothetical protein
MSKPNSQRRERNRPHRSEHGAVSNEAPPGTLESPQLDDILKRYKITKRANEQIVIHHTYGFRTVLTPEQFAVYEAALRAVYISWIVYFKVRNDWSSFMGCLQYHRTVADPNDISLPHIAESWGEDKAKEASADYKYCAHLLTQMVGRDADNGGERGLYYATLD